MMNQLTLSVLICTRNRARSLERTLKSVFDQRFGEEYRFEVIIVDNHSGDGTRRIVEEWERRHPGIVCYRHEPRIGLSYARNSALKAAKGEVLVFTDDDVRVSENWLDEVHGEFLSDPELHMLGGKVLLAREGLQEVGLLTSDERQTFVFPDSGTFAMGANMAFRRSVFDSLGGFDVRLGAGRFFAGAEEADLFYRGLKAGYSVLYAPNVVVYHDHDRVSVDQACRLEFGYGKGCSAYLMKHVLRGDLYALRMVYWLIYRLPARWLGDDAQAPDILLRRRAQIRGILTGLVAAPFIMWGRNR